MLLDNYRNPLIENQVNKLFSLKQALTKERMRLHVDDGEHERSLK
jgi:hypothetical protein